MEVQAAYVKKSPSDRKTWIDEFIALEPKGGVRKIIDRIQNGDSSNRDGSGANGRSVLTADSVAYTAVRAA